MSLAAVPDRPADPDPGFVRGALSPVVWGVKVGEQLQLAVDPAQAAGLLGVSRDVVYSLIRAGMLRTRNLRPGSRNGHYLIPVSSLVDYLDGADDPVPSA